MASWFGTHHHFSLKLSMSCRHAPQHPQLWVLSPHPFRQPTVFAISSVQIFFMEGREFGFSSSFSPVPFYLTWFHLVIERAIVLINGCKWGVLYILGGYIKAYYSMLQTSHGSRSPKPACPRCLAIASTGICQIKADWPRPRWRWGGRWVGWAWKPTSAASMISTVVFKTSLIILTQVTSSPWHSTYYLHV